MSKLRASFTLGFGIYVGLSPSAGLASPRYFDFDGNGHGDLAVGAPGQNSRVPGGMVLVYRGFDTAGGYDQVLLLDQSVPNMPGTAEPLDAFGAALAWGDFDADGYDDLVIGMPGELYYGDSIGGIEVLYGAPAPASNLINARARVLTRSHGGVEGAGVVYQDFGAALAAGDFNGDGFDDLAVGAPAHRVAGNPGGSVQVFYGSDTGIRTDTDVILEDSDDDESQMGAALTTGDFNCDGYEDLAIGSPGRTVSGNQYAGLVHVAYGRATGLPTSGFQIWHQDVGNMPTLTEPYEAFGLALAAGNFDGDITAAGRPCVDLAISAPRQGMSGVGWAGVVHVLRGSSTGLTTTGSAYLHQDQPDVSNACTQGDTFGQALAISRLDNDDYDDLVVGAVGELSTAGGFHVFAGGPAMFDLNEDVLWTQNSEPNGIAIPSSSESGDLFGGAIGGGPFGTLVVAAASEDVSFGGADQDASGYAIAMRFDRNTSTITLRDVAGLRADTPEVDPNDQQLFGYALTSSRPAFVW